MIPDQNTDRKLSVDYHVIKKASLIFRALNHVLRQHIIDLIFESGKITVTEIYIKLRLEQSVASQHLAILRRAGIVFTERKGKLIYYSVNADRLFAIDNIAKELTNFSSNNVLKSASA
jgi:ArsR family transcriptional regulator, virulence genes transcriptional regulator